MDDIKRKPIKATDFIWKRGACIPPTLYIFYIFCVKGIQTKKRRRGWFPMNLFYKKKSAFGHYL